MEPSKTQNNLMAQANEVRPKLIEFLTRELKDYGNLVDQLRVTGLLGEALLDFAEGNLRRLKFEHDEEVKKMVKVYQS